MDIVLPDGKLLGLPLLEKVMYNAREAMAVRVLPFVKMRAVDRLLVLGHNVLV